MEENTTTEETVDLGGRPKANIDWKKIEELLIAGCSAPEIAGYFGCSDRTLYARCETDLGIKYSEFSQEKRSKGEALIRAHQYAKALGLTDKGDNTLLIWLGKNRLKQSESPVDTAIAEKTLENYEAVMNQLSSLREPLSIDESNNKADKKS